MDHLYSLYDALVSINVPSDKARAVVDAMERDMSTTLATKQDLEILKKDVENRIASLEQRVAADFMRVDQRFNTLELKLTIKLGSMLIIGLAFIPVFALTGQEGKLFHPLAFTKTFAVLAATVISVTLVPVFCTLLLGGKFHPEEANPVMGVLRAVYRPVLQSALAQCHSHGALGRVLPALVGLGDDLDDLVDAHPSSSR